MRIIIDGRMILPHMSGVGRYLIGLCRGLAALGGDPEYQLWIQAGLAPDHPVRQISARNFWLVELPHKHMSLSGQIRLPLELAKIKPDLYHYPHFDLPWAVPGKVAVTIHDLKYIARPDFFPSMGGYKRIIIEFFTRKACRRSNRLICDSEFTAQDLSQRMSVPRNKLRVVPLGVDDHFFEKIASSELEDYRRRRGLESPFLLFVGERRPHKNLPGLIRTYKQFRDETKAKHRLLIVGRPYEDYRTPEKIVEEFDLGELVQFVDYAQDSELPFLFQSADAFCFLSLYEGFGLPVLEAMASGLPVVASNCTSLPEVAGPAARIVPPEDPFLGAQAISDVIPGGSLRDICIQRGLEHARQFTWERCASDTRTVYQEATGQ